jgi:hypothetical protein
VKPARQWSPWFGITYLAVAAVGLCTIALSGPAFDRRASPLQTALPVAGKEFTTSAFVLEPGYHYRIELSVDHSVPYADCLLGVGTSEFSGECGRHPSVLDIAWSLRDNRENIVASGASQGDKATFGYGGDSVGVELGDIDVTRSTAAHLTLHFRRNAVALTSLRPTLSVYDVLAEEGVGIDELLQSLLCVALGIAGVIALLTSRRR